VRLGPHPLDLRRHPIDGRLRRIGIHHDNHDDNSS
jgi:hypothetical protein